MLSSELGLSSDLISEALITTLKRFVAKCGICWTIFSDNALNFVDVNSEFKKIYHFLKNHSDALTAYRLANTILWKYLHSRCPNFGGLWESEVKKKIKNLLKGTIGDLKLTFEEFLTIVN